MQKLQAKTYNLSKIFKVGVAADSGLLLTYVSYTSCIIKGGGERLEDQFN